VVIPAKNPKGCWGVVGRFHFIRIEGLGVVHFLGKGVGGQGAKHVKFHLGKKNPESAFLGLGKKCLHLLKSDEEMKWGRTHAGTLRTNHILFYGWESLCNRKTGKVDHPWLMFGGGGHSQKREKKVREPRGRKVKIWGYGEKIGETKFAKRAEEGGAIIFDGEVESYYLSWMKGGTELLRGTGNEEIRRALNKQLGEKGYKEKGEKKKRPKF